VNRGTWGLVTPQSQEETASLHAELLSRAAAEVVLADDMERVEALLNERAFDAVIFRTRGMLDDARRLKRGHPNLRVVVITGFIQPDERLDQGIVFIRKTSIEGHEGFARMVFGDDQERQAQQRPPEPAPARTRRTTKPARASSPARPPAKKKVKPIRRKRVHRRARKS
jgi:hypothetical protein